MLFCLASTTTMLANGVGQATVAATIGPSAPYYTDDVTATVTVSSAAAPVPSGTITWDTDSGTLQTASLSNGVARINLKFFAPGAHTFDYSYSGDGTYAAVASQSLGFNVTDRAFTMLGADHFLSLPEISTRENLAIDSKDDLILPDQYQNKVFRVDQKGITTVIPTTGLNAPAYLVVDKQDDIFIADTGNARVVEVTAAGAQSVLPISGLTSVAALAFDPAYQSLYVVDQSAATIVIYNLAAQTQTSFSPGIAPLTAVAVDPSGNVYYAQGDNIADAGHLYRRDTAGNVIEIFTGTPGINGLSFDAKGNLYILSAGMFQLDPQGHLTELTPVYALGTATAAPMDSRGRFYIPTGVNISVFTPGTSADAGYVYTLLASVDPAFPIAEGYGDDVFLDYQAPYQQSFTNVSVANGALLGLPNYPPETGLTNGIISVPFVLQAYLFSQPSLPGPWGTSVTITTTDGTTHTNLVHGIGVSQQFAISPGNVTPGTPGVSSVGGVASDGNGNAYVSDPAANQVLQVSTTASTILRFTGLNAPTQLAVDALDTVFVLDSGSARILRLDAQGNQSVAFDLSAQTALTSLSAFAMDGGDNLYIAGATAGGQAAIYYVDTFGDQLLLAKNVPLPASLALDGFGNLYVVETAGGNLRSYSLSGNPTLVTTGLTQPSSVAVDLGGTAFVAGPAGSGVTIVHPDGTTTPYTSAALVNASAMATDPQGNLVVGDNTGKQIFGIARVQGQASSYDFGNVPVGATATYSGSLSNAGNAVTIAYGISQSTGQTTLVTTDPNECVLYNNNTPDTPLPPGGYCNLNITFTPTYVGSITDGFNVFQPNTSGVFIGLALTGNGTTPVGGPTLTPNPLNFGNVTVNTASGAGAIEVQNLNNTELTISSITISGPNAAQFSQTNTCSGTTLPSNASCVIQITFTPNAVGTATATVTVTDNSTTPTSTATIEGTGVAAAGYPTISVSPTATTFPTTSFGSSSAAQTLVVKNSGTGAATISSVTLGGVGATSFSLTNGCGTTLAVNASCNLTVVFTPTAASQTFTATVSVASNDPTTPTVATLSGSSPAATPTPTATLTPAVANFGSVSAGDSATQTLTLTNTGTVSLTITSQTSLTAPFALTGSTCSTTLTAGATCAYTVVFTPAHSGVSNGSFSVTDSAGTQSSSLAGTGTSSSSASPAATLTPSKLDFGSVETGTKTAAQTATLTNSGTAPLAITGISLTGTNSAAFASTNTCSATLAAGASCTISVAFDPTAAGTDAATLSVSDNAAGSPQTSALTGTATAPPPAADFSIAATPASQSVASGSTATYQINLASINGSFTQQVSLAASGLPSGATATFSPASVTPGSAGASSTMTIQTLTQQASAREDLARWPLPVGLVSAALLILPFRRRRRIFMSFGCLLLLLGVGGALTACGGGFALPQKTVSATYTVTVTGASGSLQHSTSVQITVR